MDQNLLEDFITQIKPSRSESDQEESVNYPSEIGIACSHYDHKLGPQFIGVSYDFSTFSSLTQYNILQDSISSRSDELALFLTDSKGVKYIIHIKKISVLDSKARGGIQRYALLLFLPINTIGVLPIDIEEIAEDLKQKLSMGEDIKTVLKAWHMLMNDIAGIISVEDAEVKQILPYQTSEPYCL
ncbi:MAG: hypothetical protein JW776_15755 [Candidatus Lokiarchaeota archaeon]|nr:hypothetical protein [Candidatus Lokiarchaeota archaeon]